VRVCRIMPHYALECKLHDPPPGCSLRPQKAVDQERAAGLGCALACDSAGGGSPEPFVRGADLWSGLESLRPPPSRLRSRSTPTPSLHGGTGWRSGGRTTPPTSDGSLRWADTRRAGRLYCGVRYCIVRYLDVCLYLLFQPYSCLYLLTVNID